MNRIRNSILLVLFSVLFVNAYAQQVVTFAGGSLTGTSMTVSFTGGEPISGTFSSENISLLTGFSNGSDLTAVSNEIPGADIPLTFKLKQNYPNPFNPSTNISYDLPETADVRLEVFNTIGAKVATLIHEQKPAGTHTARFDASSLASGMYLYRLTANGNVISIKKMILIK